MSIWCTLGSGSPGGYAGWAWCRWPTAWPRHGPTFLEQRLGDRFQRALAYLQQVGPPENELQGLEEAVTSHSREVLEGSEAQLGIRPSLLHGDLWVRTAPSQVTSHKSEVTSHKPHGSCHVQSQGSRRTCRME